MAPYFARKLRVGMICHSSCGGSSKVAFELARQLARRDHQVHFFSQYQPFGFTSDNPNLMTHFFQAKWQPDLHPSQLKTEWNNAEQEQFLRCLTEVIERDGLDILHFHYAIPFAFLVVELKRRLGGKCPVLIGTLHGTDVSIFGTYPEYAWKLKIALEQVDCLTTVSTSHAELASRLLEIEPPLVIPNFLDLADYRPQPKLTRRKRPRLIHISNFRPVKAPHEMISIFTRILEQIEAELWLVGDGPGLEELKPRFEEQGLTGKIRFWGLQEKVAPILAQADLLLMTSVAESFCLVALEAMACGVPVLATHVGGVPEVVKHAETGYLYTAGDHEQAVEYGTKLLSDATLHRQFAQASLVQARKFDQSRVIGLYEQLYVSISWSSRPEEALAAG
ncbi:MAG: N-acetyl-alpha-D-glucosaminyl L-malate synthase BshA [Chloroflexi bacterium]|nr:N-acetyl-alpha-D-glucosaminyl L-malate synthase BshA [Chloroflexota bacterium]OJV89531.1 MAG: N-acetyl-alpha-D-glucosaminyl L-malate synthase BshA [Chloroflexi bacterium 54-19]